MNGIAARRSQVILENNNIQGDDGEISGEIIRRGHSNYSNNGVNNGVGLVSSGNDEYDEEEEEDTHSHGNNNTSSEDGEEGSSSSFRSSSILKNVSIEPLMFMQMMGLTMTSVVVQNLYIDRICRVSLNYTEEVCGDLGGLGNRGAETEVDGIASKFVTYRSLIEAGFPIIFSLFLGPWTEVHGTKLPIILPLIGYCLSSLSYLTLSTFTEAPPELLLISSAPVSIVGGLVALIMSAFSFIAKKSGLENRSFRVAMVEASWFLGGPIGTLIGGLLFKSFGKNGFVAVFGSSACVSFVAFVYGVIVIKEEVVVDLGGRRRRRSCFSDMFNVQAVKEMFGTVFLRRSGLQRRWLLLMLFAISLRILALFGYLQNMYLYTRNKFGWGLKDYTEFSVSDSFIQITGGYIMIMTFMKIFKLPDAVIGVMSSVGPFLAQFVFAFAPMGDDDGGEGGGGWMMYFGSCLQLFSGLISIVLRAMISKVVAKEEIARVYTFLACSEAAMPLIGVPLYSYIFRHTLTSFPGAMFMVSAGAYFVILLCFLYLYVSMKERSHHEQMDEEEEEQQQGDRDQGGSSVN